MCFFVGLGFYDVSKVVSDTKPVYVFRKMQGGPPWVGVTTQRISAIKIVMQLSGLTTKTNLPVSSEPRNC